MEIWLKSLFKLYNEPKGPQGAVGTPITMRIFFELPGYKNPMI